MAAEQSGPNKGIGTYGAAKKLRQSLGNPNPPPLVEHVTEEDAKSPHQGSFKAGQANKFQQQPRASMPYATAAKQPQGRPQAPALRQVEHDHNATNAPEQDGKKKYVNAYGVEVVEGENSDSSFFKIRQAQRAAFEDDEKMKIVDPKSDDPPPIAHAPMVTIGRAAQAGRPASSPIHNQKKDF